MHGSAWFDRWTDEQRSLHTRAALEYEALYKDYLGGRVDEATFKRGRHAYGVSTRPGAGRVMLRLKILLGRLGSAQLRAAADLAERFTPRRLFHLTPRQNLHFFDVPLEDSPTFLKAAAAEGFGVAGTGGKGPGNVTLPAGAGLLPGESFDASFAAALVQSRFDQDPGVQGLPGPFKVGFWRGLHDEESDTGNDLTVIPVRRQVGSRLRRGFRLLLGGGLGQRARVEALWRSFVPPEELYAHIRAVAIHFKVRGHGVKPFNRLRHLLHEEGWPNFQEDVTLLLEQQVPDRAGIFFHRLPLGPSQPKESGLPTWLGGFAIPQPQKGRYLVKGQPLGGMLSADAARDVAAMADRYGHGEVRATTRQQLWIPGIGEPNLLAAYQELQRLNLAGSFLGSFSACPGEGICAHAVMDTLDVGQKALDTLRAGLGSDVGRATAGLRVGASACTNGCGRHKASDIGLEGFRRDVEGESLPFVRVYARPPGSADLAEPVGSLPVEKLPMMLLALVEDYRNSGAPDLAGFLRLPQGFEALQKALQGANNF